MNGWQAFRSGLSLSLRYWQILAILLVVNLLSALLLAMLPAWSLAADLGHRPAIREMADGVDAWLVVERLMAPLTTASLEQNAAGPGSTAGTGQAVLAGLLIAAALPLVAWVPAAFLNGGALLTYAGAAQAGAHGQAPPPFRWRRFVQGCWRWWGSFLLLGIVQGAVFLVLLVPLAIAGGAAVIAAGPWLAWLVVPLLGLAAVLLLMLVEWTRILAVTSGTRNLARAFGSAVRTVVRKPLLVAGLYALSLLLVAVLHLVYRLGLMPILPLDWWLLVLLVQQTFVLARLGSRLARLAGGVTAVVRLLLPANTESVTDGAQP